MLPSGAGLTAPPPSRSGETSESEGQRVMEIRGRSDKSLPTTFLEARARLYRVSGSQLLCVRVRSRGPGDFPQWLSMQRCFGIMDLSSVP